MAKTEKNRLPYSVVVKKVIPATIERVFDAWTKPEIMRNWYCGAKGISESRVDLRVGGKYTNNMHITGESSCNSSDEGGDESKSFMHHGEYLEISRPHRLVFTWNSPSVENTVVTVDLKEVTGGTEVTISHELPTEEACKGHTQGWNYALDTLSRLELAGRTL